MCHTWSASHIRVLQTVLQTVPRNSIHLYIRLSPIHILDSGPTHKFGHTLDLVITRCDDDIIQDAYIHPLRYSDHHIVMCPIRSEKAQPLKVSRTSRVYRATTENLTIKLSAIFLEIVFAQYLKTVMIQTNFVALMSL